jgi:ABC-2 type transport system ATP-binding protein
MLEIDNISFSYGAQKALDGVTFDVAAGEIVAVVGPNGAGKTTLLRVLATVLMQDAGAVRLDGVDPLLRPIRYRRGIGYLSESCPLYDEMTVEGYLTYRVLLKGERNLRVRRRVSETLSACGLEEARKTRVQRLSRGLRKRLGLADALVMHPKALLLDDPLAGLDAPHRRKLASVLTAASARTAVILAGHEVHDMLQWCTRFIVLRGGRVAAAYRASEHGRADLARALEREVSAHGGAESEAAP